MKEKPLPARMDLVRERTRVSMVDWTEERERSVTSRQEEEREGERSARVMGLVWSGLGFRTESARDLRISRITESGLRRFWNGRDFEVVAVVLMVAMASPSVSESETGWSARRRFLLSAIF